LSDICALGETVGPERPLATIHARNEADAVAATVALDAAVTIGDTAPEETAVVHERLGRPAR
jgi:thymidine phosphorylase